MVDLLLAALILLYFELRNRLFCFPFLNPFGKFKLVDGTSTPFMRYVVKIKVCIKNKVHFGGQSDGELHLRIMFHMS